MANVIEYIAIDKDGKFHRSVFHRYHMIFRKIFADDNDHSSENLERILKREFNATLEIEKRFIGNDKKNAYGVSRVVFVFPDEERKAEFILKYF